MHLKVLAKPLVFLTADILIGSAISSCVDRNIKLIWATRIAAPFFAVSTFYGTKKYRGLSLYGLGVCIGLNTPKYLQTRDQNKILGMAAAAFVLTLFAKHKL